MDYLNCFPFCCSYKFLDIYFINLEQDMHGLLPAAVTSLYLFRYNLVQWNRSVTCWMRWGCVSCYWSLLSVDMSLRIKAATLRVLLTREGHTTVRKYCQPTSTLLTRMCWAREALIIYFSAEHIFSRNAEKCNYQECEVLHRRPPVIGGGDDSK